ncbi:MAG TPA: YbaN family protein [Slackia equolifaciens]|uniref:YbaN family protein n=1 Tax=Slackia equolifaciens TaxID=498718 RepID=A0A9D3A2K3_9ACTN|nr:YbaN family protein [Slackia equolifaciens]
MLNPILFVCAWIALGIGALGVFVPVLPTTPLVLLATFLFAKSSPRCHAWLCKTRIYRSYVLPFQQQGGIPFKRKLHILGVSFVVMGVSAVLVQKPIVWVILGAVALFLLWLMCIRIPTVGEVPSAQPMTAEEE